MQTVVGLYRTVAEANQAKQALLNEGYNGGDVRVIDQSESNDYGTGSGIGSESYGSGSLGTTTGSGVSGLTGSNASITDSGSGYGSGSGSNYGSGTATANDTGVGAKIKHFFQDLTGHDEHTHSAYTEGVSRGGALVAVNVSSEAAAERAAGVLQSFGASDIEDGGRGGNYGSTGTGAGYAATGSTGSGYTGTERGTVTGEQVIPVVEEELVVGKRQVERGGVRVFSRVVSEPVSESVNLHEERVLVDRHAVNRPATEADFREAGPIEVRATGEEAVVGKTGRVVEEVVVGKTATDRTETIEDSVRRTEVDVEPVSASDSTTAGTTRTTDTTKTGSSF